MKYKPGCDALPFNGMRCCHVPGARFLYCCLRNTLPEASVSCMVSDGTLCCSGTLRFTSVCAGFGKTLADVKLLLLSGISAAAIDVLAADMLVVVVASPR